MVPGILKMVVEPTEQDGFRGKTEKFLDGLVLFNQANKSGTVLDSQLPEQTDLKEAIISIRIIMIP